MSLYFSLIFERYFCWAHNSGLVFWFFLSPLETFHFRFFLRAWFLSGVHCDSRLGSSVDEVWFPFLLWKLLLVWLSAAWLLRALGLDILVFILLEVL